MVSFTEHHETVTDVVSTPNQQKSLSWSLLRSLTWKMKNDQNWHRYNQGFIKKSHRKVHKECEHN